MDAREIIARRVARELSDNTLVNLGIGLPTMVAQFVSPGIKVYFQSENGIIGFGARPPEGMEDLHLTDAGGAFVSALPGAVAFDSAMSFALIRGGHFDMTVLGGLQVDRLGRLANWFIPGALVTPTKCANGPETAGTLFPVSALRFRNNIGRSAARYVGKATFRS